RRKRDEKQRALGRISRCCVFCLDSCRFVLFVLFVVRAGASMSESARGELAFIDWLRRRTPSAARVLIGPGDDVAAVSWPAAPCLITTDMLLEGSCFVLEGGSVTVTGVEPASARRVGRKSMAVNLSDVAAMAGVPVAAVVSVGLPKHGGRA